MKSPTHCFFIAVGFFFGSLYELAFSQSRTMAGGSIDQHMMYEEVRQSWQKAKKLHLPHTKVNEKDTPWGQEDPSQFEPGKHYNVAGYTTTIQAITGEASMIVRIAKSQFIFVGFPTKGLHVDQEVRFVGFVISEESTDKTNRAVCNLRFATEAEQKQLIKDMQKPKSKNKR